MVSTPTYINVDVKLTDAFDQISVSEIVGHYGSAELLNEIGIDEVKAYFGLVEEE